MLTLLSSNSTLIKSLKFRFNCGDGKRREFLKKKSREVSIQNVFKYIFSRNIHKINRII